MPSPVAVVLVEDDGLLRLATAEALRSEGFEVREAEHAENALRILRTRASAVHVLFTDVCMLGMMDGLALAQYTMQVWPWIALLITSGYPLREKRGPPFQRTILGEARQPAAGDQAYPGACRLLRQSPRKADERVMPAPAMPLRRCCGGTAIFSGPRTPSWPAALIRRAQ